MSGTSDWAILYGDGSMFTSTSGDPAAAPGRDVQVIVTQGESGNWLTIAGSDFYIWKDGRWLGVDLFGLTLDYLSLPGWKTVKFGSQLDGLAYKQIMRQASNLRRHLEENGQL